MVERNPEQAEAGVPRTTLDLVIDSGPETFVILGITALLSLASITPASGVKLLTEHPTAEVLAHALVAAPEPNGSGKAPEDNGSGSKSTAASPPPPGPDATQRIKGEPLLVMDWDEMARRSESQGQKR